MADDGRFRGRFQKGVDDPRRYRGGAQRGPKKAELKQRRAEDERAKQIAENDTTMPLDYLLRRMRNTDLLEHERFAAAVRAAPYCHAQLQAIAHKHLDASGNPIAPSVTVTVRRAIPEAQRLTYTPPVKGEKVQ